MAVEEIKVKSGMIVLHVKVGFYCVVLSGGWVHTFCLVSTHFLLTQPFLSSSGEPSELFWASLCPWPLLGFHLFLFPHSSSIELLLFAPASPS